MKPRPQKSLEQLPAIVANVHAAPQRRAVHNQMLAPWCVL